VRGGSCNVNNKNNMDGDTYKTKTNMTALERLLFGIKVLPHSRGTTLDLLGTLNLVMKTRKPTHKKLQAQP